MKTQREERFWYSPEIEMSQSDCEEKVELQKCSR